MPRWIRFVVGIIPVVLLVVVVTTGSSVLPAAVALGPCLRDWTSPSSYGARSSPLATTRFQVGGADALLCYGRPSLRGRLAFGGLVPFDSLWRLGANEPTRLSVDRPIRLGLLELAPGRYSLYASPSPAHWMIFVSRSTLHWGNDISPEVRARELGSLDVPTTVLVQPVETLTTTWQGAGDSGTLTFAWDRTAVRIPITAAPE